MDKIFSSKPGLRLFLTVIGLLILVLLLIRFYIFPIRLLGDHGNEIGLSFIDKFITSVVTAVIVGLVLYWIQGDEKNKAVEFTESGSEIEKQLNIGRQLTTFWHFNGGLGRYTKTDTLPKLYKLAVKETKTITIKIIVLNPFNQDLVNRYIDFKNTVASKEQEWNVSNVKAEIISTIITALHFQSLNTFLSIDIRVKDFFTLSRMDISAKLAVITREDPSIPSQILKENSYLYKHYVEEFFQVHRQSKALSNYSFSNIVKLESNHIKDCLITLFPDEEIQDDLIQLILNKVTNPKSPFKKW